MEELLIGSILIWALGRITKKNSPPPRTLPGTLPQAPAQRSSQGAPQQMPSPGSVNYGSYSGGSQGPAYNPNNPDAGPGGGRPGVL